jgi:hypothetical protein
VREDFVAVISHILVGTIWLCADTVMVKYKRNDDVYFLYEANFNAVLIVTRGREKFTERPISLTVHI